MHGTIKWIFRYNSFEFVFAQVDSSFRSEKKTMLMNKSYVVMLLLFSTYASFEIGRTN